MAKLGKRGYPALYLKGSNAWYTGYAHDWKMEDKVDVSDRHEVREMKLQYTGFSRGRSAANIEMVDQGGNKFLMSMSGFDLLMKIVDAPENVQKAEKLGGYDIHRETSMLGHGVWYIGSFCQTKQGQNYFIEPVEERKDVFH